FIQAVGVVICRLHLPLPLRGQDPPRRAATLYHETAKSPDDSDRGTVAATRTRTYPLARWTDGTADPRNYPSVRPAQQFWRGRAEGAAGASAGGDQSQRVRPRVAARGGGLAGRGRIRGPRPG